MSVKDIFISFWQLTTKVIFAKKSKVLFYYPQHFNRTAQATNPFFDRMLETCDKHSISYQLIEEPDWGTDKPRNPRAIKGDVLYLLILLLRKIVRFFGKADFYPNEKYVACILDVLTLGKLRRKVYITTSGSLYPLLIHLYSGGEYYDMQHGILYKQHPSFFDESMHLRPEFYHPRGHWLMWGKGYDECFCRGEEDVLSGRTHVVGYPISPAAELDKHFSGECILFSLQFTHDSLMPQLEKQKAKCEEALRQLDGKGVKVLLKHHPRFNDAFNIDDWMERFPFCELSKKSMTELLPEVMLQITFNSTTSFEYAEYGIPSYFIDPENELKQRDDLFYREYRYPLYKGMALSDVVDRLHDNKLRSEDAEVVRKWYREFYDEFNESEFLKLIEK